MRKQYFFRQSDKGLLAWDVEKLIAATMTMPRFEHPLANIKELDQPVFGPGEVPSWRSLLEHMKLLEAADLAYPIILSANGEVMDGMHRVTKAVRDGKQTIEAVQFSTDPPPDFVAKNPQELTY